MFLYLEDSSKFAFSRRESFKEFLSSQDGEAFGMLGIPFDSTATYMPGARFGPSAIREASYNFEGYNLTFNRELKAPIFDLGDVSVVAGDFKETSKRIIDTLTRLLSHDLKPLILGGEHTITYPILKTIQSRDNPTIIHFDAHMDMRDHYNGKFTHATVMRRVYELEPQDIIMIGVRSASREEIEFVKEHEIEYYTSQMIQENIEEVTSKLRSIKYPVYVTVDMDVLDPSHAPMVGNPTPCGLTPFHMEKFIEP